jgi:GAF domain-containing protein
MDPHEQVYLDVVPDPDIHALDNFADRLAQSEGVTETLSVILTSAVDALPGVDVAGITVLHADGSIQTVAFTNPVAVEVDEMQGEVVEGPLYAAETDDWRLVVPDVADESRWPAYGARLAELGIRAQMAIRLRVTGRRRALLNLYAHQPGSVAEHHVLIELFVTHATLAIDFGEAIDQLNEAVLSRKMIGQALGLVMAQYGMTEEQAFAYLRRISQDRNVKLREVCGQVVSEFDARAATEAE